MSTNDPNNSADHSQGANGPRPDYPPHADQQQTPYPQQAPFPQGIPFPPQPPVPPVPYGYGDLGYKRINKHIFVWVGAALCGGYGADRFMRGQMGIGVAKLLLNPFTLGIWGLVDWIIAVVKAYGGAYGDSEDLIFDSSGNYIR